MVHNGPHMHCLQIHQPRSEPAHRIRAAVDERLDERVAVERRVEERRVAAHVANQVAHPGDGQAGFGHTDGHQRVRVGGGAMQDTSHWDERQT